MKLDDHLEKIEAVLASSAPSIVADLPRVKWHIKSPRSRVYALATMLIFVDCRQPMEELCVIDVTLKLDPAPTWTIDASGRHSQFLGEVAGLSESEQAEMVANANVAARRVRDFMDASRLRLIDNLAHEGPNSVNG